MAGGCYYWRMEYPGGKEGGPREAEKKIMSSDTQRVPARAIRQQDVMLADETGIDEGRAIYPCLVQINQRPLSTTMAKQRNAANYMTSDTKSGKMGTQFSCCDGFMWWYPVVILFALSLQSIYMSWQYDY
jgi:hypothetical protein